MIELKSFCGIARLVSESTDKESLIRQTVDIIIKEFGFEAGVAFLQDKAGELKKHYSKGLSGNLRNIVYAPLGGENRKNYICISTYDPIVEHDISDPSHHSCLGSKYSDAGFQTLICLPLKVESKMIGAIHFLSSQKSYLSQFDKESLSAISEQLAIGIDKIRLYEESENQKNFLENLINSSISAIVTMDLKGRITLVNSAAEDLLGFPGDQLTGKPVSVLMADSEKEALKVMNLVMKNEKIYNYETKLVNRNNETVPVLINTSLLKNKHGEVTGIIAFGMDMRSVTRLENRLMKQEQYLANILSSSAEAIITLDENHTVRSWNRGAEMIFGYSEEEMVGSSFLPLIPNDLSPEEELTSLVNTIKKIKYIRDYETERLTKDGRRIRVLVTATALYDDAGKFIGRSAFIRDITESKKMEETLIRAEKLAAIGELSASLAHEIKNPLAGIDGAINVIGKKFSNDESLLEIFEEIKRQIKRLNTTIDDLLDYASPREPDPKACDINSVMEKTMLLLKREPRMSGVRLLTHFGDDLPLVVIDSDQIEQVFLNIILNALAAIESKGTLEITSGISNSSVFVKIKDDGKGIEPGIMSRIFDPFFTTRSKGTGIGLSISKNYVESNNGKLEVSSEPGKGSEFTVLFPVWRN